MTKSDIEDMISKCLKRMILWLGFGLIAIFLSWASFDTAESGKSYYIWTGGILVGFLNFFRYGIAIIKLKLIIKK